MKSRYLFVTLFFCLSIFLFGFSGEARAQAEPFYKGKTIRIIIGSTPGGFYDRWARLLARFMVKYIPGQPEIIAQSMPGAGSMIVTNHVFNVAKPDGLTIAMPLNSIYVEQLVGRKEVQFDLRKFHWIGSPAVESSVFYMRADAPYKSIDDVIKAKEPPKCGSTGTASVDYILSKVLEETVGAKFNTVPDIQEAARSTWPWKKERWFAAPTALPLTLVASPLIHGTRKISTAISYRLHRREIHGQPMCPRFRKFSISIRSQPLIAVLPRWCWQREISAAR
jgi:hypothetical protein